MIDRDNWEAGIQDFANAVCRHVPDGYTIHFCFDSECSYVELIENRGRDISLPDTSDKSTVEQINDALCVANGWDIEE